MTNSHCKQVGYSERLIIVQEAFCGCDRRTSGSRKLLTAVRVSTEDSTALLNLLQDNASDSEQCGTGVLKTWPHVSVARGASESEHSGVSYSSQHLRGDLHGTSISPVITCRTDVGARCVRGPGTAWASSARSLRAELPSKNESSARPRSGPPDGRYYSV